MGSIGGLLGVSGGAGGSGFAGPNGANITNPVEAGQTATAYQQSQDAQAQQRNLLAALQGQNGIQNQSNVYNQLQGVANGTGPNPAQAMLAQQTGQNVANQAALMAGQRGAGANAGLIARQAAQAGGNLQQQAVGQGATMQANQSLNAIGQAGQLAGQQVGQQQNQTNQNTGSQQAQQQMLYNATQGVNQAQVSNQASINAANAGLANTNLQGQQGMIGGIMNGIGGAAGLAKAQGGMIHAYAGGGDVSASGPQSSFGKMLSGMGSSMQSGGYGNPGANALAQGMGNFTGALMAPRPMTTTPMGGPIAGGQGENMGMQNTMMAANGGKVPALVSPGEQYIPPQEVKQVAEGKKDPLKAGEKIPGTPKYPGNDYRNDTVSKTLDEGGLVIPNAIMQSKNPHWAAKKFVEEELAKGKKK